MQNIDVIKSKKTMASLNNVGNKSLKLVDVETLAFKTIPRYFK